MSELQSANPNHSASVAAGGTALGPVGSPQVREVRGPVKPEDVEMMLKVRDADERLQRLRTLVCAWQEEQKEERKLRRTYALGLIGLLAAELVAIFAAFFLLGTGKINVPSWAGGGFLIAALAQSTSLVLVVVKHLFPERSSDVLRLIQTSIGTAPAEASLGTH